MDRFKTQLLLTSLLALAIIAPVSVYADAGKTIPLELSLGNDTIIPYVILLYMVIDYETSTKKPYLVSRPHLIMLHLILVLPWMLATTLRQANNLEL